MPYFVKTKAFWIEKSLSKFLISCGYQSLVIAKICNNNPTYIPTISLNKFQEFLCCEQTLDSGTNAATRDPGALESSTPAIPGILIRCVIPLEKSAASKICTSFVARRHATASSALNLIEGLNMHTLNKRNHINNSSIRFEN